MLDFQAEAWELQPEALASRISGTAFGACPTWSSRVGCIPGTISAIVQNNVRNDSIIHHNCRCLVHGMHPTVLSYRAKY